MRYKPVAEVMMSGERGYAQRADARHHVLHADEPATRGGTDTGPTPYELLLTALAGCTAITLRMYAERKQWDLGRIEVRLKFFRSDEGEHIERKLRFSAHLSEEQRERLLEISGRTPVTITIGHGTRIDTRLARGI